VRGDAGAVSTPERWGPGTAPMIPAASRPLLPRHVRLRFGPVRGKYVVLAPEKLVRPLSAFSPL
jgi:hypothetical protein